MHGNPVPIYKSYIDTLTKCKDGIKSVKHYMYSKLVHASPGKVEVSGASGCRLVIIGIANKSKLQVTPPILGLQIIPQLSDVVLNTLNRRTH